MGWWYELTAHLVAMAFWLVIWWLLFSLFDN